MNNDGKKFQRMFSNLKITESYRQAKTKTKNVINLIL